MRKPSIKLNLESLESRLVPSAADVAAFQATVPALQSQFDAAIPAVQANLQQFLNSMEAQYQQSLMAAQYQQAQPIFAYAQLIVDDFKPLADAWFNQQVQAKEDALLAINAAPQPSAGASTDSSTNHELPGYYIGGSYVGAFPVSGSQHYIGGTYLGTA